MKNLLYISACAVTMMPSSAFASSTNIKDDLSEQATKNVPAPIHWMDQEIQNQAKRRQE